jgi:hypothetical protein
MADDILGPAASASPATRVQFTSDWDGPMDGQAIDPDDLPGYGLYPWETASGATSMPSSAATWRPEASRILRSS